MDSAPLRQPFVNGFCGAACFQPEGAAGMGNSGSAPGTFQVGVRCGLPTSVFEMMR